MQLLFPPEPQMRKEGLTTSLQQLGVFLLNSEGSAVSEKGKVSGPSILLCDYGPLRMVALDVMLNLVAFPIFLLLNT